MIFGAEEPPTSPVNSPLAMTITQVREALSAFPNEQQPLVLAMLRAADQNGFYRGVAGLSSLGPFEQNPASDSPKKGRR